MSTRDRGVTQAQEERSSRSVQDENEKGDLCCAEACEGIARRMVKYLEDREVAKATSMRELEEQVLSPNESRINIVRIGRQARNDKKRVVSDLQTRRKTKSSSQVRRDGINN